MRRLLILLALVFLPVWGRADAEVVKPLTDFCVADYADVLSDEVERLIVVRNDQLQAECGAQIVVVTVDTVGEADMEDYAYTLFSEWEIGGAQERNGLLILLAIEDGKYWLMSGKGIQHGLSAAKLQELAELHLLSPASAGLYDEAVWAMFEACLEPVREACLKPVRESSQRANHPVVQWLNDFLIDSGLASSRLIALALILCVLLRFFQTGGLEWLRSDDPDDGDSTDGGDSDGGF